MNLKTLAIGLGVLFTAAFSRAEAPPNFIVIFTDDQGYQDLGCYGSPDIATPHLDRMASEGMRFTSFYAQTICGPSRTALMTGSYPLRVGQVGNRYETHPVVHSDEITIAEVLQSRGYKSGAFGKWDLATHSQTKWIPELLPRGQGFDYFFGTPSSNDRVVHLLRNEGLIEGNADMGTLTQRYTDEAIEFIEKHRDEPFFVYVAHTMPHTLLEASEEFKGKSKGGLYGDVIEEIDHHAGRILDKVKELGFDENTYVIFTSDNGPWLLRKDHGGHALPLRSGKTTCWEGGLRVPCIVRAPGRVPAGTTCDLVTATLDLLPTFAALAGAELPKDRVLDGVDLSAVWHGEQQELDRAFYYYQHHYLRGVRQGDWKVMLKHEEGSGSATARWANHVDPEDAKPLSTHQLFNLKDDIGETTDLAGKHPRKLAGLLELAERARKDVGDYDRIGENARFFDPDPNRLETSAQKPRAASRAKPVPVQARPAKSAPKPPNVVLIFADDLGYGDLSCYGATKLRTPNIDRLAKQGRRFTDAHSASAVCTPSRYALLTGEYPHRRGLSKPVFLRTGLVIDPSQQTLASVVQEAGYDTACIGKWHLGFGERAPDWNGDLKPGPLELGFDYYFGVPVVNSHPPFVYVENHRVVGLVEDDPFVFGKTAKTREFFEKMGMDQIGGADAAHALYDDEAVGTKLTEKAVNWIRDREESPFFLYLSTTNIHHPFTPAPRFQGTSDCGPYGDFVHELDWMVGEVMKTLEEEGVADDTLVIFTSDNGGMFNVGGQDAWEAGHRLNGDLLGFKFGAWEGGHRVPFIVRWPGKVPADSVSDQLISNIDLIATAAALTGQELGPGQGRDSVDLLPALTGDPKQAVRDHLVLSPSQRTHLSIRKGDWMYIGAQGSGGFTAAKRGAHAFGGPAAISYAGYENSDIEEGKIKPEAPPAQLYDLASDPQQTQNLYHEKPEKVEELKGLLESYTTRAPVPASPPRRTSAARSDSPPPNVVLIFADDLGYGDLGCYGATKLKTPEIDRLANEGRRFTDAHSSSAVCTPSRYGLLTGEYPFRALGGRGLWGPAPPTSPLIIDPGRLTMADVFKDRGYDTAAIGKWHLGFKSGRNDWQEPLRPGPQDLGFDYYFGMPVVNSAPPYVYVENGSLVGGDPKDPLVLLGRGKEGVTPITPIPPKAAQRSPNAFGGAIEAHKRFNDYEVGTTFAEKATAWIRDRDDAPFFLYLSTTNVHHPFTPAKRFQDTSDSGVYGDFVHELDWMVGQVMKVLEETGAVDNTLVVFTSDNGGMFNHGGRAAAAKGHKINGDLLGSKFGIWEGGHRVPFIAWWPGRIEAGTVSDQLISNVDLMATFAALTGRELGSAERGDSINMMPALTGDPEAPLRTEMFVTPNKPTHMALRRGRWMYIPAQSDGGFRGSKPHEHAWGGAAVTTLVGTPNSDIENGRIKEDAPPAQLYDLKTDVNQTTNLYHERPLVVKELATSLKLARQKADPPAAPRPQVTTRYDGFKPLGPLRFTFESGGLEGWSIVDGGSKRPVSRAQSLPRHKERPFCQQGSFHLSTIATAGGVSDEQQVVFQSPSFVVKGDQASFLVSGGFDEDSLFVALVDAETEEVVLKAGGSRGPQMQRVIWEVGDLQGKTVYLQVVDRNTGGWGHLTFDDFSVEGTLQPRRASKGKAKPSPKEAAKPKVGADLPNFVVIFADDLGYGDLSCYDADGVETPHLDALAAEGFRSTDFFVPANVCSPSRAALLTGRYPMRCGLPVARNESHPKYKNYGFSSEELTIPKLLKPAGYRSLIVGKWHLGMEVKGSHPLDAGFDEHLGIPSNYEPRRGRDYNTLYRGREVEQRDVPFEELTRRYTDEVIAFIERQNESPFFVFFSHHIPHNPLLPSEAFRGSSRKGKYGDVVRELDHSTGRIMAALKEAGLDDNTLVVFTSDNGPTGPGSTAGLAGGKYCTMEGGHRVPGIIRWPGRIPEGQVSEVTLTSMDLLPLFCGLAEVELPDDRTLDGKDILPILQGETEATPHPYLCYYNGTHLQAVRQGDWKLHLPRTVQDQPFWNRKPGPKKGFVTLEQDALFNLAKDPGETRNLAEQRPEIVQRLHQLAQQVRSELGDVDQQGSDQRPIALKDPQVR